MSRVKSPRSVNTFVVGAGANSCTMSEGLEKYSVVRLADICSHRVEMLPEDRARDDVYTKYIKLHNTDDLIQFMDKNNITDELIVITNATNQFDERLVENCLGSRKITKQELAVRLKEREHISWCWSKVTNIEYNWCTGSPTQRNTIANEIYRESEKLKQQLGIPSFELQIQSSNFVEKKFKYISYTAPEWLDLDQKHEQVRKMKSDMPLPPNMKEEELFKDVPKKSRRRLNEYDNANWLSVLSLILLVIVVVLIRVYYRPKITWFMHMAKYTRERLSTAANSVSKIIKTLIKI